MFKNPKNPRHPPKPQTLYTLNPKPGIEETSFSGAGAQSPPSMPRRSGGAFGPARNRPRFLGSNSFGFRFLAGRNHVLVLGLRAESQLHKKVQAWVSIAPVLSDLADDGNRSGQRSVL